MTIERKYCKNSKGLSFRITSYFVNVISMSIHFHFRGNTERHFVHATKKSITIIFWRRKFPFENILSEITTQKRKHGESGITNENVKFLAQKTRRKSYLTYRQTARILIDWFLKSRTTQISLPPSTSLRDSEANK